MKEEDARRRPFEFTCTAATPARRPFLYNGTSCLRNGEHCGGSNELISCGVVFAAASCHRFYFCA
jgi:hypothetical protein